MVFQLPDSKFWPETMLAFEAHVTMMNPALLAIMSQLSRVL
jgi:hypothetical protein